ncbi:esterase/lipase family protein [Halodesulfovibrio marinisediminis]|uniref:Putative serine esterase n=1 Tax=Halodesulfovibrio marinisediminis DSM 17456 TaxID=1121457 RepID=A0A1N6I4C1_9BACT|nr:alpha/beta fold hydrolase [Halodesulfovibrio marinisediminis]SIO26880.1 Putative serine esterase [Halodesulfovibrio marinisediminis DSM 17456]
MTLLSVFLLVVVLICIFIALTSYFLYWYEHEPRLDSLFSSRKEALHAVWLGFLTALKALFFTVSIFLYGTVSQCCWRKRPKQPTSADSPIIMIHGLFHNSSAWVLYRHWFKMIGLTNCAAFYYSSGDNFDEVSRKLNAYMEEFFQKYPEASPILIGHSLGGLLIRNWLANSHHANKVAGVITLGTPMLGSKLATFSVRPLGQQLKFKSKLIQQIEKSEQERGAINLPCFAMYSPVDNMVLPQESVSTPPEGWNVIRTKPVSHIAMLSDKSIALQVGETAKQLFAK